MPQEVKQLTVMESEAPELASESGQDHIKPTAISDDELKQSPDEKKQDAFFQNNRVTEPRNHFLDAKFCGEDEVKQSISVLDQSDSRLEDSWQHLAPTITIGPLEAKINNASAMVAYELEKALTIAQQPVSAREKSAQPICEEPMRGRTSTKVRFYPDIVTEPKLKTITNQREEQEQSKLPVKPQVPVRSKSVNFVLIARKTNLKTHFDLRN